MIKTTFNSIMNYLIINTRIAEGDEAKNVK